MPAEKTGTAEPVGKRVRRQLRGCGVEEARGFSNWPYVSAPSPVVLPAEHGGQNHGGGVALTVFLGVDRDQNYHFTTAETPITIGFETVVSQVAVTRAKGPVA
jgi:hypothetical protein